MLLTIDPHEPEPWLIARGIQALRRDGLVVIPTDTVYGIACALSSEAAVRRLYEIKGVTSAKRMSILVGDLATASRFTRGIPNHVFRAMRRVLPGPYTFIFQASSEVPRVMLHKRRTVGIRLPDCPIALALLQELGEPLLTTSVRNLAEEFVLDPAEIEKDLGSGVDLVIDGGLLANDASTVIDLTGEAPELVREGKGDVEILGLLG